MKAARAEILPIKDLISRFFNMKRKGRNNTQDSSGDCNKWMVTFSDLIMLLLTFFVLLLTMSTLDQKALREMISYLNDSLGAPQPLGAAAGSLFLYADDVRISK